MKGEIKMKDRIKELWDKSKSSGVHPTFGEYDMYSAEKFAESIVKECVTVLNNRFMGDMNREDLEVRRCIADVKQHFGVEE